MMSQNTPSQQQISALINQNQTISQQLAKTKQQHKKLHQKYQKALQQLALIVRANETLKKQYDHLEFYMNSQIDEKTQANKAKMKQYLRNDLDQLNQTIEKLTEEKDKLQLDNSTLKMKLNSMTQQKIKILKQKEQLQIKYQTLENELQELDPETRDNNSRALAVKQLKEKARLVDELQLMIQNLQEQKQSIQKQYQEQLTQIENLWNEWREFQKELASNGQDHIKLSGVSEQSHKRENDKEQDYEARQSHKKRKRRGSVIFEEGMDIIKGKGISNQSTLQSNPKRQTHELTQLRRQLESLQSQLQQIKTQNTRLKSLADAASLNERQVYELKKINERLTEDKLIAEQKLSQVRIKQVMQEATQQKRQSLGEQTYRQQFRLSQTSQSHANNNKSAEDDLISILRDLHEQLSPLRHELMTLKKQQMQHSQTSSTERATFQVKLIRLQKELAFHKQHNEMLKKQLSEFKSQKSLINQLQKRLEQTEEQKSLLEGKVIVLETLNVADRTRVDGETYAVLKQFQKRMELLVQGDSLFMKQLEGNHVQHLVAMKAYILELDERLKKMGVENEKLQKKYVYSKEKINQLNVQIKQLSGNESGRMLMYKQKLQAYDKLVNKLTIELQKNISKNSLNSLNNIYNLNSLSQAQNNSRTHYTHVPQSQTNQQSRFTSQVNHPLNQEPKPSQSYEYNQVISLYEEKMVNMGEEIVRIRGDRESLEGEVRQLRLKLSDKIKELNDRIKELNDKQRELVIVKTQNINFTNENKLLHREIAELQAQNQNQLRQPLQSQANNQTPQNKGQTQANTSSGFESTQIKYERQIATLKSTIQQLEAKVNHMQDQRQKSPLSKKLIKEQEHYQVSHENNRSEQQLNQLKQERESQTIRRMRQQFEQEQIASVQLAIAKHQEIVQKMEAEYQHQLSSKLIVIAQKQSLILDLQNQLQQLYQQLQTITQQNLTIRNQSPQKQEPQSGNNSQSPRQLDSLQAKISVFNQHIARLQQQNESLSQLLKEKQRQLRQLEQVILKNNHELTQLRNQKKFNQYSQIQTENLQTPQSHQLMQENSRLNNLIFQLNVKISGLESVKYNLKLENQILKGDCEFIQDRLNSTQNDIKMKNSTIFHLENDLRNYSSTYDSTIMAKDSLIRSYQNQIKNLKRALNDLKSIMTIEKEQLQNKVKDLQIKLKIASQGQHLHLSDNTGTVNNSQLKNIHQSQNKESSESLQLKRNNELMAELQLKIDNLQSQLKQTHQQLLNSSEELSKLQQLQSNSISSNNLSNANSNNISNGITNVNPNQQSGMSSNVQGFGKSQESNSNISVYWQEQVDKLNGQVLSLRSNIITLKDQIQFKEQKISQLKHEIYKLKMKLASFESNKQNHTHANHQDDQLNQSQKSSFDNNQKQTINDSANQNRLDQKSQQKPEQPSYNNSPKKSPIHIISSEPFSSELITELQSELNQLQLHNNQLLINETNQNQTISLLQAEILKLNHQNNILSNEVNHLNHQSNKLSHEVTHLNHEINHYKLAESSVNQEIIEQLQKLRNREQLTENEKCKLLAEDISKLESAIYEIKNDYELELNTLKNKIKTLENQLHAKDLKISQLMRTLLQTRISITDNQKKSQNLQNSQITQSYPDINYLLQQIQRQTQLISAKQLQLSESNTLLSKLQSQKSRANQNLALIVLLIVQIESLRNQLQQSQTISRKEHSQTIQSNKMTRNASREMYPIDEEKQKVDFSLIKILQCSHQHLVNYEKMIMERRDNSQSRNSINEGLSKTESSIGDPLTLTVIKSSNKIIQESEGHPSFSNITESPSRRISIEQNPMTFKKLIIQSPNDRPKNSQIKSQQILQGASQSNENSEKLIDSTYSINNPFRHYYRHAESTYNPMLFSPSNNDYQGAGTSKKVKINMEPINLGSFGKISESHNVESSYGSIQNESRSSYVPSYEDEKGYSYTLKNVNMIQSVDNGDSVTKSSGSKIISESNNTKANYGNGSNANPIVYETYKEGEKKFEYSLGKSKQLGSNPSILGQVESRYILEKRQPNHFSPSESLISRSNTSSTLPLTSEIRPGGYMATTAMSSSSRISYPSLSGYNQASTSFYTESQANSSSKISSNSYLPTYNNNQPAFSQYSQQYRVNIQLPSSKLFSTNLGSTLADTSATYQYYMSKPL